MGTQEHRYRNEGRNVAAVVLNKSIQRASRQQNSKQPLRQSSHSLGRDVWRANSERGILSIGLVENSELNEGLGRLIQAERRAAR
jgi:hypothetical protein